MAAVLVVFSLRGARGASVFEKNPREYAVKATLTTSDDKTQAGLVYTTLGKPLKVFDREKERFVSFRLSNIARIDVEIDEEWEEPVWYWKESGSDEKVYTGRTYPVRKYRTSVTFTDDRKITGTLSGLVYLETENGEKKAHALYERQKRKEGQKPGDLVYVRSIVVERGEEEGP